MPAHLELMILGLLVAVVGFGLLSSVSRVPYPVYLVIGGLALSLVPGLPAIELPPQPFCRSRYGSVRRRRGRRLRGTL